MLSAVSLAVLPGWSDGAEFCVRRFPALLRCVKTRRCPGLRDRGTGAETGPEGSQFNSTLGRAAAPPCACAASLPWLHLVLTAQVGAWLPLCLLGEGSRPFLVLLQVLPQPWADLQGLRVQNAGSGLCPCLDSPRGSHLWLLCPWLTPRFAQCLGLG